MASSSKYKKDIADYDSFNARISKLKLKQANTPRKQHAADEFAVHYKVSCTFYFSYIIK